MGKFHISTDELLHILISVITISVAFAIVWTRSTDFNSTFLTTTGIIILTVGAGFVLHELAHKYFAVKYGAHARYQAWTLGLLLAIIMAFTLGFVFAAPGAVYIYGHGLTRRQNGIIALAGPATNLILGLAFLALALFVPALAFVGFLGSQVNFFLGAFNLLPFFPMDGQKIYSWDVKIWAAMFFPMVALALFNLFSVF